MNSQIQARPLPAPAIDMVTTARNVRVGDSLLNAAGEPVVKVTKVEHLHRAHPRVRLSGVRSLRDGRREGWVRTVTPATAVALLRPVV